MNQILDMLFWANAVAFSIHIIDESTVGGGFIKQIKDHFWPSYNGKKFFWFNTVFYLLNVAGILLYEHLGGPWILFPLSFAWLFATNGICHVIVTVTTRKYSPGLVTSPIYWIILLFIYRFGFSVNAYTPSQMLTGAVIGSILTILMYGSFIVFRIKNRKLLSMPSDGLKPM